MIIRRETPEEFPQIYDLGPWNAVNTCGTCSRILL